MTQPSLLDAIAAADRAINQAGQHADPDWYDAAILAVRQCARQHHEFTTDELWQTLETWGHSTHEPRAMGAVMRQAKRDGIARPTGNYRQSTRGVNHARPVAIWRAA